MSEKSVARKFNATPMHGSIIAHQGREDKRFDTDQRDMSGMLQHARHIANGLSAVVGFLRDRGQLTARGGCEEAPGVAAHETHV